MSLSLSSLPRPLPLLSPQESEEAYSQLLTQQLNSAYRSTNLLPRSRFLELCVFKKMLLCGLHLKRHLPPYIADGGAASMGGMGGAGAVSSDHHRHGSLEAEKLPFYMSAQLLAKPTTLFADPDFKHLWYYKSFGAGVFKVNIF